MRERNTIEQLAIIADQGGPEGRDRRLAELIVAECKYVVMNQGMFLRFNELADKIEKDVLK